MRGVGRRFLHGLRDHLQSDFSGQGRTDWFGSEPDAKDARFAVHMEKAKRG